MKSQISFLFLMLIFISSSLTAQNIAIPEVELITLYGSPIKATEVLDDHLPIYLYFWKTNDNESFDQLNEINELFESGQIPKNIKIVAICIDCTGQIQHVKPFVNGHNINLQVYIDKNGDFKRSMSVSNVPYLIQFDKDKKIMCRKVGNCAFDLNTISDDKAGDVLADFNQSE